MSAITKGLQMIADFLKLFIKAVRSGKVEPVTDGISVAEQWLKETVNTAGVVKISPVGLLLGADPWSDSRKMYREFSTKWAGRL